MNHGSLFSGIGGFDLASEWMGWDNKFHCEWEDFPRKILKHYWPEAESYGDIKQTDFTIWRDRIDILTGGFPCQPYSSAGKRLGKEDDRHLWPEMLRAIREIKPRWVIGENVRGLVNWNDGVVFEEVHSELEAEGYEVQSFLLPACGVGAPHRRDRIWFVAYSKHSRYKTEREEKKETRGVPQEHREEMGGGEFNRANISRSKMEGNASDSSGERLQRNELNGSLAGEERKHDNSRLPASELHKIKNWEQFPTQSPICSGDDGIPSKLDNITFSKWRRESIKGYGNAIVPQVVYQIFKAIQEFDNTVSMNCKNS